MASCHSEVLFARGSSPLVRLLFGSCSVVAEGDPNKTQRRPEQRPAEILKKSLAGLFFVCRFGKIEKLIVLCILTVLFLFDWKI
jgi:hypothetical protein